MWQLYALGSLVAGAFEEVVDKAGLVRDPRVDSTVATFCRGICFFLATAAIGVAGILGEMALVFHWLIFVVASMSVIGALLYTYIVRHVEVVTFGAVAYLSALLFLVVDTLVLGIPLSWTQITGIILLVLGGVAFTLDGKTHHFNRELTWRVWGAFFFVYVLLTATEAYAFKYLHATHGFTGVGFYVSTSLVATALLFLVVLARGKIRFLFSHSTLLYVPYAIAGKSFDALNSVLFATALTFAAVSQVSAFSATSVLVLLAVATLAQQELHVRLKEKLDRARFIWKVGAIVLLVLGGFTVH